MSSRNANFPENMDISPSTFEDNSKPHANHPFGYAAQRDAIEKYGIAGRIWEAAYLLSIYVNPPTEMEFDPPFIANPATSSSQCPLTILELGSGAGMTSSRIAKNLDVHDMLIVTDLPEVCPLLERNLKAHALLTVQSPPDPLILVRPLTWGTEFHGLAIASERSQLLAPLLRSLLQVTSPPFSPPPSPMDPGVTVVISYKLRSLCKETPFWAVFGLWFTFAPVLVNETSRGKGFWQRFGSSSEDTAFIFVAHRRPESYAWNTPTQDSDLLAGRGAMGNDSAKADDTFESLLFMTLEEPEAC
ncbi:hypothetical protein D9615_010127 [Tricholomella constricta]|uniref:Uncharacterized protein n=1 Tax=Tricholomella constricta TaxID=117010 RepID=A0A8H5GX38_9AGAR|nr:hypothetical protein D9615_010127 [Tricholomella constricta]